MRLLSPFAVLLVLLPLMGAGWALHAYHTTLTELRYNAAKKQLELSVKVFTDDFEKALSEGQPAHVNLSDPGPRPLALASAYVQRTLKFSTAAGAPLPLQVLGMQAEKDGYWLYCKVPLPGPVPSVQLRQAMLLDVFGDQMNIVNIEAGDKKQSALFRAGHEQELLTW
ncbi:hypothetical protein Q3A66_07900 [Hymenobacter sp. BT770]|uniref:DUF6702 family protein n=1 Tax=Hymenobacter sp. BT770 TaxID=2886942 RepID=UPI001D0FEA68|nr:DUF6702 family protein [Hymenobacter sp. BT770]MCC3152915.1 hypothetical protein [Hymenobacter sp. BT770]MDO3414990.1 hypothetical protein [Hymenobacter sp. BT770]